MTAQTLSHLSGGWWLVRELWVVVQHETADRVITEKTLSLTTCEGKPNIAAKTLWLH